MKKISLALLITAFSVSAFAQTPSSGSGSNQKFHFGLKAAPSISWLRTDSKGLESDGSKFGFSYGLITEFNFAEHYAFSTGLDVTYRGGKFKQSESNALGTTNTSSTFNLEYIEIPLTLKLKTNEIGSFTYFLQFGVAPGYNIRARKDYKSTSQPAGGIQTSFDTTDVDIQIKINSFNLSMIIAGGLEYSLSGNTVLLADLTFNNGFLDVLDDSALKANSNYLALTVGILF